MLLLLLLPLMCILYSERIAFHYCRDATNLLSIHRQIHTKMRNYVENISKRLVA